MTYSGVAANLELGNARKSYFSPHSLLLSSPSLPFSLTPSRTLPSPILLACPSLLSFLPFLLLEVDPLNPARELRSAVSPPPASFGAEPQPKSNWVHFSFKM